MKEKIFEEAVICRSQNVFLFQKSFTKEGKTADLSATDEMQEKSIVKSQPVKPLVNLTKLIL